MIESIAFTMYPVKDVVKSRQFYEDVLGLKMTHTVGRTNGSSTMSATRRSR